MTIQTVETTQPRKRRKQPDEIGQPNEDFIKFEDVATELKQIVDHGERDNWRLGELAYRVEPRYGEKTLAKLAKENGGIAECTLRRRRNTYEAWFIKIRAAPPESFAVAQELQAHPDRANIIKRKPDITTREARKLMREHNQKDKQKDPDSRLKQYQKWFKDMVNHANAITTDAEIVDDLDLEQREILRQAIEPELLKDLLQAGNDAIKLLNFLQRLVSQTSPDILMLEHKPDAT